MAHGLLGRQLFAGAERLVVRLMPSADRLVVDYGNGLLTNLDAFEAADFIEQEIHKHFEAHPYRRVILFGHSAGAALLRKAFVWGHGREDDRSRLGLKGKRVWVDHVERIVLLAGLNRGWSASPKPREMPWSVCIRIRAGELLARALQIARFSLSMRRGAPFIADTRVQWIRIARSREVLEGLKRFPQVIQVIGSRDDLVSREDGQDLLAARDTVFKTLARTGHRDIADVLSGAGGPESSTRAEMIGHALTGNIAMLEPDRIELPPENPDVDTVVYVMHGIRDYGKWTDELRLRIDSRIRDLSMKTRAINPKYGYFAMLPFLLYQDRQRNVRRFMDQYTEDLSRFPGVVNVDFAGHSNGTYILASALQHYATIKVRRVFFAGSVVPKHYPWGDLIDQRRVGEVINVVATGDGVVAVFPKVFEQIADILKIAPTRGWLDVGAAGFHGFTDADGTAAVSDIKFCRGDHGTAVDIERDDKLNAIAGYLVEGASDRLAVLADAREQSMLCNVLSNLAAVVWILLIVALIAAGASLYACYGVWALIVYIFALLLLLHTL